MLEDVSKDLERLSKQYEEFEEFFTKEINDLVELSTNSTEQKKEKVTKVGAALNESFKSIYQTISKVGKSLDKNSTTEATELHFVDELDSKALHSMIANHFVYCGQFETAEAFAKETQTAIDQQFILTFKKLHTIQKEMGAGDCELALAWSKSKEKELKQLESNLHLRLIEMKFVQLLEKGYAEPRSSGDHAQLVKDALAFAQTHLVLFLPEHQDVVRRLMGCCLYLNLPLERLKAESCPYRGLFDPDYREKLLQYFQSVFCCVHGVLPESPLQQCIKAGRLALPSLKKMKEVVRRSQTIDAWRLLEELPMQVPLPKEFEFHSIFACPLCSEKGLSSNPPILLKCGHVICHTCMDKLASGEHRRFKCPTCPVKQTRQETIALTL